jgi:hypothetical protein
MIDEQVMNFLNSLKNLHPIPQKFPGCVYKISFPQNESLNSFLVGTQYKSEPFCDLTNLIAPAEIVYFENMIPENVGKLPIELIEEKEKLLNTKIQKIAEYKRKSIKFLDNSIPGLWEELFHYKFSLNSRLSRAFQYELEYTKYSKKKIPLEKVIEKMDDIENKAYEFYDIETCMKSNKMKKILYNSKYEKIEEEYDSYAIDERNLRWMGDESKLVEDLTTKNVVIVVGYEHLFGHGATKFGLIDLFRKKKFDLTPVPVSKFCLSFPNEKDFPNEKEYYDKIREVQNFLIEFCRAAFTKSNISVKIHGLEYPKSYLRYNGKYGIVHKLMKNETNTFTVFMEEDKSIISVSKKNIIFVQKIPN